MGEPALVRARYKPDSGMFEFIVHSKKKGSVTILLPPREFLGMVKYLGKVAVSYQEWLKSGGDCS